MTEPATNLPPWPRINPQWKSAPIIGRATDIRVGVVAFWFDVNTRVYRHPGPGGGSPIYRYHYNATLITGETRVSWITEHGTRYPKKSTPGKPRLYGLNDVDEQQWMSTHRLGIVDAVRSVRDFDTLKTVADLVGYVGEAP